MRGDHFNKPETKLPEWAVIEVIDQWSRGHYSTEMEREASRLRRLLTTRYDIERKREREHASHGV